MKTTPILLVVTALLFVTSCTSTNKLMREPNTYVEMNRDDFILSEQFTATASSTRILGVDWSRLFNSRTATVQAGNMPAISFASVPVIGQVVVDQTANIALFTMMTENPGYDVVYYPQIESTDFRPVGIGLIYKETTVTVTARLAKLKTDE